MGRSGVATSVLHLENGQVPLSFLSAPLACPSPVQPGKDKHCNLALWRICSCEIVGFRQMVLLGPVAVKFQQLPL